MDNDDMDMEQIASPTPVLQNQNNAENGAQHQSDLCNRQRPSDSWRSPLRKVRRTNGFGQSQCSDRLAMMACHSEKRERSPDCIVHPCGATIDQAIKRLRLDKGASPGPDGSGEMGNPFQNRQESYAPYSSASSLCGQRNVYHLIPRNPDLLPHDPSSIGVLNVTDRGPFQAPSQQSHDQHHRQDRYQSQQSQPQHQHQDMDQSMHPHQHPLDQISSHAPPPPNVDYRFVNNILRRIHFEKLHRKDGMRNL